MELKPLERKVSMLQACVRGFLVRRHFQSLRAEYEAIVREIDGDLGTLQWTEGWIPTPRFPPQKAKSPWILQAGERTNPKRAEPTCLCKKPEKEAICEKTTLKVSRENSTLEGRLPHTDARPQGQSGKAHLDRSADWQWMKKPETAGPGLPHSQMELQELRSHLAMELLWLQQAINSRKEYLILKQTLRSPEAGQTRDKASRCPDQDGQLCESPTKEDQPSSNRATGETDQTNDAYWGFTSQSCKSPERLGSTDKNTIGSKYRDPGQRRAGPQLSTPSENLAKKPGHGKQSLGGMVQQVRNSLEDQTPKIPCSGKARTQSHIVHEDPHFKDTFPGAPSHKELDCQRIRPQEDRIFLEGLLEGLPEHHDLDLWGTKVSKGQTLSGESSGDRITNMASHEEWKNGREAPWSLSPTEKRTPAA
ncbi:IQ domain-containing protein C [Suncus etruscus]|uniref:IQ domain-containing protein C n=1 Tax=Suncus etruscus TaxID=109475 RepID=UPI002110C275|nr:IQ domain-containing protein C [Suncus etruscus]